LYALVFAAVLMFLIAATATTLTPGSPLPAYAKVLDWLLARGAILPTMIWGAQEFPVPLIVLFLDWMFYAVVFWAGFLFADQIRLRRR
jgi:hypothetical protein